MKVFAPLAAMLIPLLSLSQKQACCDATQQFAQLGNDAAFRAEHQLPAALPTKASAGEWIMFNTPDGSAKKARGYYIKAATASANYLFIYHEWWGLNEHIMREAELWAGELKGVNVIALDLYDGKVATTRESAAEFMQNADELRIRNIIQGALDWAGPKTRVASLGWCFGGTWSMQSALMAGPQAAGCIVYYGMPERNSDILNDLQCKVLGIFAENDKWINRKMVAEYESAMNTAGKAYETHWYPADHAFANPSNSYYNEAAAKDAHEKCLAFLVASF